MDGDGGRRSQLVEFKDEEAIAFWLNWRQRSAIALGRIWVMKERSRILFLKGDPFLVELETKEHDRSLQSVRISKDANLKNSEIGF